MCISLYNKILETKSRSRSTFNFNFDKPIKLFSEKIEPICSSPKSLTSQFDLKEKK